MALPFRVYWQPGCTSCLRTKEFLAAHGVPFESINVLQSPTAMAELRAMGLRSVPVLAQGERFTQAQDIDDVARFVGIDTHRNRLSSQALLARLDALLALSASIVAVIPEARLGDQIPQRPRSYADIAYHVGMITQGFLDAADERRRDQAMQRLSLTYEHFERTPAVAMQNATALPQWLQQCRVQLADWGRTVAARDDTATLQTYYGVRPMHGVLERTAWHVAQHVRQLDFIATEVLHLGAAAACRLPAELLDGLPVPAGIWDPEVVFA